MTATGASSVNTQVVRSGVGAPRWPNLRIAGLVVATIAGAFNARCDAYFRVEGTVVAGEHEGVRLDDAARGQSGHEMKIAGAPPVPGVRVKFEHPRGAREATTDSAGSFTIEGATSHLWNAEMVFSRDGYRTLRYPVKPPTSVPLRIRVTLAPEAGPTDDSMPGRSRSRSAGETLQRESTRPLGAIERPD